MPLPIVPPLADDGTIPPALVQAWNRLRATINSLVRKSYIQRDSGTNNWKLGLTATDIPAHHTTHESGGSDAIKLDDLDTPDDNTDLNATTGEHGLLKKLSGSATDFMDGTGNWSEPASGIADGDYGDITVSMGGTLWEVDSGAIAYSELTGVPSTFAPSAHHTSHESGGGDAIQLDNLAAPDDNTDLNVSITAHGLTPKLPNDATKFLDGTGAYAVPAGTGATSAQLLDATRRAVYKPFTTGTDAYEFEGSDLGNFTAVNSGSHTVVATEDNDMVSLAHPGGDATAELHAWMKSATINANDYVEAWGYAAGKENANQSFGVIMADGASYGAGAQVGFWVNNPNGAAGLGALTNYSTLGTTTNNNITGRTGASTRIGIRLQYLGSNNWAGFLSQDGINWANVTGTLSRTMTPTYFGFFCSTWGVSSAAQMFGFYYCRKGT